MILYLVKSTLLLALLLGLYKLLLENEKMHRFNRFYLMFALIIGLTAPLIQFEIAPNTTVAGIELDKVDQIVEAPSEYVARNIEPIIAPAPSPAETNDDQAASVPEKSFPTGIVLLTIYLSITTLLIIRFGHGLFQIFSSVRKGTSQPTIGATLVLLEDPITPQSFIKWIFLNREEYESGKIGEEILEHERAHIRQLHSLDVVFTEVLKAIFWFNPFMYWYKHAVLLNHEFLADEHVVTKVSPREQYQEKLLEFASSGTKTSITNKFAYLNSKKRLTMISRTLNPIKALSKLLVIGLITTFVTPACMDLEVQDEIVSETKHINHEQAVQNAEYLIRIIRERNASSLNAETTFDSTKGAQFLENLTQQLDEGTMEYIELAFLTEKPSSNSLGTDYAYIGGTFAFLVGFQNSFLAESENMLSFSDFREIIPAPEQLLNSEE